MMEAIQKLVVWLILCFMPYSRAKIIWKQYHRKDLEIKPTTPSLHDLTTRPQTRLSKM